MKKQLALGMSVYCSDGEAGRLERIVADPETQQPTYLVIRRGPPIAPRDIVVPISLVTEVGERGISLDITEKALASFPDYELTVERPLEEPRVVREPSYTDRWPGVLPLPTIWDEKGPVTVRERTVPAHTTDIRRGMTVYDPAGNDLGQVDGVIVDPDRRQVSHLVLRRGLPLKPERRLVPIELVDFVIRSDVYLSIAEEHVAGLPTYEGKA